MKLPFRRTAAAAAPNLVFTRQTNEFDRSLGFFDATYAFALTLLILNVDLPPAAAWQSPLDLLEAVSGQAIGFLTSFIVIVFFWLANQGIISRLRVLDRTTIILNIVVIGLVVLVPFTTQAISDPGLESLPLPTIVYALNVATAIAVQTLMYEVAMGRGSGFVTRSAKTRLWERIDGLSNPAVFLLSIPVTLLLGGVAGKLTWLLMIPLGMVTGRFANRYEAADLATANSEATANGEVASKP